ncbi:MAG: hypothetical protein K2Q06_02360, partial [Parvularculaceae bacterium]|nr:hypothetical protein [Parvularculaceae bacterium]
LARLALKSGSERDNRIAYLAKNPGAQDPWRGADRQTFNDRRAALKLVGPGEIPDAALLPAAVGVDPISQCVSTWKDAVETRRLADEEARRALRLGRRPAAAKPLALDDPAPPPSPDEARCLIRLIDLDFDGDEDLLLLASDFDPKYRFLTFSALLRDAGGGWRVGGQQRLGASLPADADWRDDRSRVEPYFAAVTATKTARLDFVIDGAPVRWFPTRPPLSREALAASVDMRGDGAPPSALLVDSPVYNPLIQCADGSLAGNGTSPACFGRRLDLDGDGVRDFVLIAFSELAPSMTLYREGPSGVEPFGQASGVWREWQSRWDPKKESQSAFFARERASMVDAMKTAPSLIGDLDVGGQRVLFDYPASPASCAGTGPCPAAR